MSYEYIHIGVSLLYRLDSLWGGYEVDQLYILAPCALNYVNARVGAAAGSQHGIYYNDIPLGNIGGQLAVVVHGQKRLGVPVKAYVAYLGGGYEVHHAVYHSQACAQYGNYCQLLAGQYLGMGCSYGSFYRSVLQLKVTGRFIGQQGSQLLYQSAELLGAGGLIPEQGQLMLYQRVVDYDEFTHFCVLLLSVYRLVY